MLGKSSPNCSSPLHLWPGPHSLTASSTLKQCYRDDNLGTGPGFCVSHIQLTSDITPTQRNFCVTPCAKNLPPKIISWRTCTKTARARRTRARASDAVPVYASGPAPAAAQSAPSSRRSAPCCLRRRCSGPSSRPSCRPSALRSPPSASVRAPKEALLRRGAVRARALRVGRSTLVGSSLGSSPAPPGRRPRASTRAGQPAAHPRA